MAGYFSAALGSSGVNGAYDHFTDFGGREKCCFMYYFHFTNVVYEFCMALVHLEVSLQCISDTKIELCIVKWKPFRYYELQ